MTSVEGKYVDKQEGMNMEVHFPSELLRPFIKIYRVIECLDEKLNSILPDTSLVMAFRFQGQVNYLTNEVKVGLPSSSISGLRKSRRLINYSKGAANILVIFKEAGANAFIKEPLNELFQESVPLDNFIGFKNISDVEDQLAEATNNTQRINLIEQFLLSKLYNHKPDTLILASLERIRLANGLVSIKRLASELYVSLDAFEKRFRRMVGVSPKQFSYITRMRSILTQGMKGHTLTEVALEAGYFDQPHFNKDFKLFTGQTPTDFMKSPYLM